MHLRKRNLPVYFAVHPLTQGCRHMTYHSEIAAAGDRIGTETNWDGIAAESVARMRLQNRFQTGLDIARYTAKIMRADMAAYDADPAAYTQSLGCWHGFIGQQKMISIKKPCLLYTSPSPRDS